MELVDRNTHEFTDRDVPICLSGSLAAMRFITAVEEKAKDGDRLVENVSRELWKRIWSTDQDICEPASLSEVLMQKFKF